MKRILLVFLLVLIPAAVASAQDSARILGQILAAKGVISAEELGSIDKAGPEGSALMLAKLLVQKGLLTQAEATEVANADQVANAHGEGSKLASTAVVSPAAAISIKPAAQAVLTPKPQTEAPPPVTSQSKLPVSIYGTILWNSFYNTGATNIEDVPLLSSKKGTDPLDNFAMTVRQSRLGMRYQGSEIMGAKIGGQVEVDFFGGQAALPNGINMGIIRLRLAYGRLDWKRFSLVAGQDWSIFAPLNPTSLAGFAIPDMAGSGNPWIRTPQIRAEFRDDFSDTTHLQWQIAATDPNVGDYSTATFQTARTPGIGEHGRMPGIDTRLALTAKANGQDATVGLSSHYNRGENLATIAGATVDRPVDSWGVALDYTLPLAKRIALTGEAFEGRALGIFSAGLGQSVLPVGTPGEHGVEERGGWTQAQFNVFARWQANAAYGMDLPNMSQLRAGDRSKNQTYMANLMFKFSPRVTFAWEWRRFLTDYRNQPAANSVTDHVNMSVGYQF